MKILVTGANGFVGKNLCAELRVRGFTKIYEYDIDTNPDLLELWCSDCEFVFHLAGVNRSQNPDDFMDGNFGFTSTLLETLIRYDNKAPVLITSSIQAEQGNPYGISKKAGEDLIFSYGRSQGVRTYVFRLANLFGKWSRPNYNSVVATFCYNISRDIPIQISDPDTIVSFVYIDDVVRTFADLLEDQSRRTNGDYYSVTPIHDVSLGRLAELLEMFADSRSNLVVPKLNDPFVKALYSTYLSYLPEDQFAYDLKTHADARGSFTEFLRMPYCGQVSINVSKPGITKGDHWHHTKVEKFLVVSGEAVLRFRKLGADEVIEYRVSADQLRTVDIPVGYTHSIENVGDTDLVTVIWANETFDPEHADTYSSPVIKTS